MIIRRNKSKYEDDVILVIEDNNVSEEIAIEEVKKAKKPKKTTKAKAEK